MRQAPRLAAPTSDDAPDYVLPAAWDAVFGDLDVRMLSRDQRLDLVNKEIQRVLDGKDWMSFTAGDEGHLAWDAALQTFVDGIWVACIFCCHVVCEREVAGVVSVSPHRFNGDISENWEGFGLGRLLKLSSDHQLIPANLIDELRRLADARKPYGHWRSAIHPESLMERSRAEYAATGHPDRANLIERLVVRDATHAMLTTSRLYFGNYGLGGP